MCQTIGFVLDVRTWSPCECGRRANLCVARASMSAKLGLDLVAVLRLSLRFAVDTHCRLHTLSREEEGPTEEIPPPLSLPLSPLSIIPLLFCFVLRQLSLLEGGEGQKLAHFMQIRD